MSQKYSETRKMKLQCFVYKFELTDSCDIVVDYDLAKEQGHERENFSTDEIRILIDAYKFRVKTYSKAELQTL